MNKILPLIVIIAIAAGAWMFMGDSNQQDSARTASKAPAKANKATDTSGQSTDTGSLNLAQNDLLKDEDIDDDEFFDFDDRPAAEIYKTAEDAFKAIKEGAKEYDDLILEQFTQPGEDCTWCPDFYSTVVAEMINPETGDDERSYYAEVLAISGNVDNMNILVQAIVDAGDSELADLYAEALELTVGDDNVVDYLTGYIESDNELLQESVVAAITNQSSIMAAQTLYDHTIQVGDEDGYYSLGIGLAELIPDEDALPFLEEKVRKRDKFSHLALKSLLNNGLEGTKRVIEILASSSDPEADRKILEDAVDHVNYEEEIEDYMKRTVKTASSEVVVEFAKEVLSDFEATGDDEDFDDDDDDDL